MFHARSAYSARKSTFSMHTGQTSFLPAKSIGSSEFAYGEPGSAFRAIDPMRFIFAFMQTADATMQHHICNNLGLMHIRTGL